MTTIRVTYRQEDGGWWAESPDLDNWVAGGATLTEAREQAHEGLRFFVGEDVEILEGDLEHPVVQVTRLAGVGDGYLAPKTVAAAAATLHRRHVQVRQTA